MTKKQCAILLAAQLIPYVLLAYVVKTEDTYFAGTDVLWTIGSIVAIFVSFVYLAMSYQLADDLVAPIKLPIWPQHLFTSIACLLLVPINSRQYYYPGGDVDPVAYQQGKTTYLGGYHLLEDTGGYHLAANKSTYQQFMSQEPHWQLPFSSTIVLSHIPSIIEINERKISMNLPHTKRGNECTLSLIGGVVHIPFDEEKVGGYLKKIEDRWSTDPEFDITMELEGVFSPIFKSIQEPLPEGTIYINLDVTDGILGHLEEQYGFRIVALPNSTPLLKCTIKYVGDPPINNSIQLLRGEEVRISRINEQFPPRKKPE